MSSARDRILGSLRRSLGREELSGEAKAALEARLAHPTANLTPARSQLPHAGQVELFIRMAERIDVTVARIPDRDEVPGAVADYLASHNLPTEFRMSPDPFLDAIPWERRPLLKFARGRAEPADLVGVTPAFAAVAETATLMMVSGPERPATLNFMPDTHIVVLESRAIVGTYEEGFARLRTARNAGTDGRYMPRTVNLITGPSRTADIALTLILGAHGPRRLHVVLVDGEES